MSALTTPHVNALPVDDDGDLHQLEDLLTLARAYRDQSTRLGELSDVATSARLREWGEVAGRCNSIKRVLLKTLCAIVDDPVTAALPALLATCRHWALTARDLEEYEGMDRQHAAELHEVCEEAADAMFSAIRSIVDEQWEGGR